MGIVVVFIFVSKVCETLPVFRTFFLMPPTLYLFILRMFARTLSMFSFTNSFYLRCRQSGPWRGPPCSPRGWGRGLRGRGRGRGWQPPVCARLSTGCRGQWRCIIRGQFSFSLIPSYLAPNVQILFRGKTLTTSPEDDESAVSLGVLGPWPRGVAVKEHQLSLNVLEHDADAGLLGFVLWDWS